MYNVTISTDGACSGNPGPGGYAAVIRFGDVVKEVAGYESKTTNNRMELIPIIEGLAILKKPCRITLRSDSKISCDAVNSLDAIASKNWVRKTGAKYANVDLLQQILSLKTKLGHELVAEWTKGHAGDPDNERCDFLAKEQIRLHTR